jgi:hypothetical protein
MECEMTRILDINGREIVPGSVVRYQDDEYEVWRVGADGTLGLHPGHWTLTQRKKQLTFAVKLHITVTVPIAAVTITGWNDPAAQYSSRDIS